MGYPFQLGHFTLVDRIATGGMGAVFAAQARTSSGYFIPVALKLLRPHLEEDAESKNMGRA